MGCDWKGRGDWTTITYPETFQHAKDFNFCYSLNCTKQNLLHKISLFKVLKIHRFLVAQIGEVIFSLSFLWLLISSVEVKKSSSVICLFSGDVEHQPKGDGRPPDLHLNSLWICSQSSPLTISTWCMILRFFWLGPEPTLPVRQVEMLTTRPPSLWFQSFFSLYIDLLSQFVHFFFVTGSSVILEYIINLFSVLHTLDSSSANQSPANLQV